MNETQDRITLILNATLRACAIGHVTGAPYPWVDGIDAAAKIISYDIDRLQRELAEARAFISAVIDAPKDYPAEEGM